MEPKNKITDYLLIISPASCHEKTNKIGNCTADQRLCFSYTDSTLPLLLNSKISMFLACFCDCTG